MKNKLCNELDKNINYELDEMVIIERRTGLPSKFKIPRIKINLKNARPIKRL